MKTIKLSIDGMTCGHCVMTVRKALAKVPGTTVENVEIGTALVSVDEGVADEQTLVDAVSDAGYTVTGIAGTAGS